MIDVGAFHAPSFWYAMVNLKPMQTKQYGKRYQII
jgi:hypothetical protein